MEWEERKEWATRTCQASWPQRGHSALQAALLALLLGVTRFTCACCSQRHRALAVADQLLERVSLLALGGPAARAGCVTGSVVRYCVARREHCALCRRFPRGKWGQETRVWGSRAGGGRSADGV